jgi:hypothetical protein
MTIDKRNAALQLVPTERTDEQLLDELDELVLRATEGDSRAVGAIAIAFSPTLLEVAREELGPIHRQDDADVLQTFCLELMEGQHVFPRIRGAAIPWMKRMIRIIARRHIGERGPDWDLAG